MRAVRLKHPIAEHPQWSASSPAPSNMIELVENLAIPKASEPGDVVVKVKATSVVRDNLTWPELYTEPPAQLGNDFAGVVVESLSDEFVPGDEVFGMVSAHRGGTWSEYVLVKPQEICLKPKSLSWDKAGVLPLSALTADQALFDHAGITRSTRKRVLITGAAGAVGLHLTQFALDVDQEVVAATSSNTRNSNFLDTLGLKTIIEYSAMALQTPFDIIIDTVGGDVLRSCWSCLKEAGSLITIDSASWNFVEEHKKLGLSRNHTTSKAVFFIVEPSRSSLQRIYRSIEDGHVRVLVSRSFPFANFQTAYEFGNSRNTARGRVALSVWNESN